MANPWWNGVVPNTQQRDRYRAQVSKMVQRFNGTVAPWPPSADVADTVFLHSTQHVLARDDAGLPAVLGALHLAQSDVDRPIPGLARIRLAPGTAAPQAVDQVAAATGARLAALDRVVHLASASACPATEPVETTSGGPVPGVNPPPAPPQRTVSVAVIDTGLPPRGGGTIALNQWPWMANVTGDPEDTANVGHYKGHGLFVAGVLAAAAPTATIHVHPFIFTSGGRLESDLVKLIASAATPPAPGPRPDIISMSAGTSLSGAPAGAPTDPLIGFEALAVQLQAQGTLLVCAAGNDAGTGPFEPASLGWPVAVGALEANGSVAGYSNRGPWVDVYARGTDVVSAFQNGAYIYEEPPRVGGPQITVANWLASWSGTSFATPIVAGTIANRMATHNESAAVAWAALRQVAYQRALTSGGVPTIP